MIDYLVCDAICDLNARRERSRLPWFTEARITYADSFLQWVADLGRREGEWLRDRANIREWSRV